LRLPCCFATLLADLALGFFGKISPQLLSFYWELPSELAGHGRACAMLMFWPGYLERQFSAALELESVRYGCTLNWTRFRIAAPRKATCNEDLFFHSEDAWPVAPAGAAPRNRHQPPTKGAGARPSHSQPRPIGQSRDHGGIAGRRLAGHGIRAGLGACFLVRRSPDRATGSGISGAGSVAGAPLNGRRLRERVVLYSTLRIAGTRWIIFAPAALEPKIERLSPRANCSGWFGDVAGASGKIPAYHFH